MPSQVARSTMARAASERELHAAQDGPFRSTVAFGSASPKIRIAVVQDEFHVPVQMPVSTHDPFRGAADGLARIGKALAKCGAIHVQRPKADCDLDGPPGSFPGIEDLG